MTTFSVWAPTPKRMRIAVDSIVVPMTPAENGWWDATVDETRPGARYGFLLDDDDTVLPDPRSPRQPDGVHGRSAVHYLDPQRWTDHTWTGRILAGGVIYELHVGTFTEAGTFDSAIRRLDHLAALGVSFVEVMPVNAVNGHHNWGYDGVGWYAVHEPYGGPDGLQRFVDACHSRGLAVILDVVYSHLGPSGNYLPRFGPYLADGDTGWGATVNLTEPGCDQVRRFIIDNALRWMDTFHIDGLRLDAVHALADRPTAPPHHLHLLEQLAIETETLSAHLGRPLTLIAESDLNDPVLITPRAAGGYGLHAQWDDDIHHAVHAAVSGERQGYYVDFGSLQTLSQTMLNGFFHAGTYSTFRGRVHGRPLDVTTTPASALIAYPATHDQIGNRARGERPAQYLDPGLLAVKAALILFSPYTPMIFMGEEWGARTAFRYFTSHPEPELAAAVTTGRRREFAEHGWPDVTIPDPQDPNTFLDSRLDWSEPSREPHDRLLDCYRALLALRRDRPELTNPWLSHLAVDYDETQRWIALHRSGLSLLCNLADAPRTVPFTGRPLLWWSPTRTIGEEGTSIDGHGFVVVDRAPGRNQVRYR